MADGGQRELERRAAQGDANAQGRLLLERVRRGELLPERLDLLVAMRDPIACRAAGTEPPAADPDEDAVVTTFRERLAEALVWCVETSVATESRLRSDALMAGMTVEVFEVEPWSVPIPNRVKLIQSLAEARAGVLREGGWPDAAPRAYDLAGGRLLLFDADGTLADGAAEAASGEFFDVHNAPPFECYVHYALDGLRPGSWEGFRSYAVCYVPPIFVPLAERGIQVNPEQCILWASDHDGPFAQTLKAAGLA